MVDAPCVRVDRASGQCCDVSEWRSAVQQKTSLFLQCIFRRCLFSVCIWHFVRLTHHAAVFFVRIASLHIPAPMRLCLRHVRDAAACLRKVASYLSHVSQAFSLHVPSSHSQCVSRSGPNSGRGSHRCQGYKLLFHPVFLLLITLCIVPAASGVRVATPPMGVAEAALDQASKKCDAAKQHGYQDNPGNSAMSRSVKRAHRRACARASKQGGTWYRGKWCTFRSLGGDFIPSTGRCNGKGRSRVSIKPRASQSRLEVLTWNCGGLSVGQLDELLCHLAVARPNVAVVCLQETLWRHSNEWLTDEWICIHDHDPQHRHASMLTMISRKWASPEGISHKSHIPGRLLQVRFPVGDVHADVLNCYQIPWNTRTCKQTLLSKREAYWLALTQALQGIPRRNYAIALGDYNTQLIPEAMRVGTATLVTSHDQQCAADGPAFQRVLTDCDMVALNTWKGPKRFAHTYSQNTTRTQIDHVLIRREQTDAFSKQAMPQNAFPVAADRLDCLHRPIQASLNCRWRVWRGARQETHGIDLEKLRKDCRGSDTAADTVRAIVRREVSQCPSPELLNRNVRQAVCALYPVKRVFGTDHYKNSAVQGPVRRLWELWRQVRGSHRCDTAGILHAWRRVALFKKQRRQVQAASRESRRQRVNDIMQQAAKAADVHDQASLYKCVNRLAPKAQKVRTQIRNEKGEVLTKVQELQMLVEHFTSVYQDDVGECTQASSMPMFTCEQISRCLRLIPPRKAVPKCCVPAVVWKVCHAELAEYMQQLLCTLWSGPHITVPRLWKDAWLALVPKPNKTSRKPSDLRPLGLQCSLGKAAIKLICEEVKPFVEAYLADVPQYAYCKGRDVQMALSRALFHFDSERARAAEHTDTIQNRHAGRKPPEVIGAMTLSLDMEKAFERTLVLDALRDAGVPSNVIHLVDVWHRDSRYHIEHGAQHAEVPVQRGVRQGCLLAPILFACAAGYIVKRLPHQPGLPWRDILTMYADDFLGQVSLRKVDDISDALKRWGVLIDHLESCGLSLSAGKSVILARITGTKGAYQWKKFLVKTAEGWKVRVPTSAGERLLTVTEQHKYLGAVISYKQYEAGTFQHRLSQARQQYRRLQKYLHSRKHLSLPQRIQMWKTCVWSALAYSLNVTGLGAGQAAKLRGVVATHLRAIAKSPRHITAETTTALLDRLGFPDPMEQLCREADTLCRRISHTAAAPCECPCLKQALVACQRLHRQRHADQRSHVRLLQIVNSFPAHTVAYTLPMRLLFALT